MKQGKESIKMKIKIKQIKSSEVLQRYGNKFFTKIQIEQIASL